MGASVNITPKQAKALNLVPQKAKALIPRPEYDSQLEERYAWHLYLECKGRKIRAWKAHPGSLKIAEGVRYNPDFLVVRLDGVIEFHEV